MISPVIGYTRRETMSIRDTVSFRRSHLVDEGQYVAGQFLDEIEVYYDHRGGIPEWGVVGSGPGFSIDPEQFNPKEYLLYFAFFGVIPSQSIGESKVAKLDFKREFYNRFLTEFKFGGRYVQQILHKIPSTFTILFPRSDESRFTLPGLADISEIISRFKISGGPPLLPSSFFTADVDKARALYLPNGHVHWKNMKRDFVIIPHWRELLMMLSLRGMRLPMWNKIQPPFMQRQLLMQKAYM